MKQSNLPWPRLIPFYFVLPFQYPPPHYLSLRLCPGQNSSKRMRYESHSFLIDLCATCHKLKWVQYILIRICIRTRFVQLRVEHFFCICVSHCYAHPEVDLFVCGIEMNLKNWTDAQVWEFKIRCLNMKWLDLFGCYKCIQRNKRWLLLPQTLTKQEICEYFRSRYVFIVMAIAIGIFATCTIFSPDKIAKEFLLCKACYYFSAFQD